MTSVNEKKPSMLGGYPPPDARLRPVAGTSQYLSGTRVLDLSIWRPGPYATSLLVPLGADVLKDQNHPAEPAMRHYANLFASLNGGKRSVELNLKKARRDGARALELASQADVLVEGIPSAVCSHDWVSTK